MKEVRYMKMIDNINVVKLLDYFETQSEWVLMLEHCKDRDLNDYILKKGKIQEKEVIKS